MISLRTLTVAAATLAFGLVAYAQTPVEYGAHRPATAVSSAGGTMPMSSEVATMARLDDHMKLMREVHKKMMRAKTPEERSALMPDYMKAMHDGKVMMAGMKTVSSKDKHGRVTTRRVQDKVSISPDMAIRYQHMEERMEMMQSMMQKTMDNPPQATAKK